MKTILIADDDVVSRKILKQICQKLGYNVIECENGEKALGVFRKKNIQILISDWMMPNMDGISLCEKIRNGLERDDAFIFLITGKKKGLKHYTKALAAGVDDFLYKPVDFYVFRNQLRVAEKILAVKEGKNDRRVKEEIYVNETESSRN